MLLLLLRGRGGWIPSDIRSQRPLLVKALINVRIFFLTHFSRSNFSSSSSSSFTDEHANTLFDLSKTRKEFYYAETVHAKFLKNASFLHLRGVHHVLSLYTTTTSNLVHAHKLFDETSQRDVQTWTIMISGFTTNGSSKTAFNFFTNMQTEGSYPNKLTFSTILKCCSMSNQLQIGKAIHAQILLLDVGFDIVLENSLLSFYAKCSDFEYADKVFDSMSVKDIVSWNIMIGVYLQSGDMKRSMDLFTRLNVKDTVTWNTVINGHLQNGFEKTSLDLLYQMVQVGLPFNTMTFSIALLLASSMSILQLGLQIHARMLRNIGTCFDGFLRNSLIDMYSKCGKMDKASLTSNGILCGSMVIGYLQNGLLGEGFELFVKMFRERIEVNEFTLASVVSACANAGILDFGLQIHSDVVKNGHMMDLFLRSSLIDMYAKNGQLDVSWSIFELESSWNVVLWTSMVSSCASHGDGKKAVGLFEEMLCRGIKPNEVSFLGVLTGCSHAGLLEEGCRYFRLMEEVYGLKPCVDHYMCMVDLFGRAGRFSEMKDFVERNSLLGHGVVLRSCLSSSLIHKDVEMAKWVSEKLVELEQPSAILSNNFANNFANSNRWEEVSKMRDLMKERCLNKQLARSWIAT